jgi:hypothetical protein
MYEEGKSGLRLIEALKKWKAEAYCPVFRWTSPAGAARTVNEHAQPDRAGRELRGAVPSALAPRRPHARAHCGNALCGRGARRSPRL